MTELEILKEAMQRISDITRQDIPKYYSEKTGKTDEHGESYAYVCGMIGAIADYALDKTAKHPQEGGETNESGQSDPHRQMSHAGAEGADQGGQAQAGSGEVAGDA